MILSIDTSDQRVAKLSLRGLKTATYSFATDRNLSERLMPEIKKFLKKHKVSLNRITKVEVASGPGPFSHIRTGVATANALAFGLGLNQKIIKPLYTKEPNITKPNKKYHVA